MLLLYWIRIKTLGGQQKFFFCPPACGFTISVYLFIFSKLIVYFNNIYIFLNHKNTTLFDLRNITLVYRDWSSPQWVTLWKKKESGTMLVVPLPSGHPGKNSASWHPRLWRHEVRHSVTYCSENILFKLCTISLSTNRKSSYVTQKRRLSGFRRKFNCQVVAK